MARWEPPWWCCREELERQVDEKETGSVGDATVAL